MTENEYLAGWLRCAVTDRLADMYPVAKKDIRAEAVDEIVKKLSGEIWQEISTDWLDNAIIDALDEISDRLDWSNGKDKSRICKTCKWYEPFSGTCCNGKSPDCADFMDEGHTCAAWEKKGCDDGCTSMK